MMQHFGIAEEWFTADEFFYYYEAQAWMMKGAEIENWPALLHCWYQKRLRRVNNRKKRVTASANEPTSLPLQGVGGSMTDASTATDSSLPPSGGTGGGLDTREELVSSWLDCQYPMPEEPEKREQAEKLERCYSLENQPQFGQYEHLKQILTSNTITLQAAAHHVGQPMVERIIIRHIDDLAAHFQTTLLTYSLHDMQQTARWIIDKAPSLKFSELMLICQRAKEERQLRNSHVCRGDIKQLILNFPSWKRNALEFL